MKKSFIEFLGTGGARYVIASQLRSSAGIYLHMCGKNIIIDPGPGTLVKMAASKPCIDVRNLDALMLTHSHIDHSNDLNVLIDAMTAGGIKKQGVVYAPADCIKGVNSVLLEYLRNFPQDIITLQENKTYQLDKLQFRTSLKHKHPVETYGLIFEAEGKTIGFLVDTGYFKELSGSYSNLDILVINTVLSQTHVTASARHLSAEDLGVLIPDLNPKKVIMTHFGTRMIEANPYALAKRLSDKTAIDVIAASDGLRIYL